MVMSTSLFSHVRPAISNNTTPLLRMKVTLQHNKSLQKQFQRMVFVLLAWSAATKVTKFTSYTAKHPFDVIVETQKCLFLVN